MLVASDTILTSLYMQQELINLPEMIVILWLLYSSTKEAVDSAIYISKDFIT